MAKKPAKKLTPGLTKVKAALDEAFGKIEAELKAQLKKAYRENVTWKFDRLLEHSKIPDSKGRISQGWSRRDPFYGWHQYTKFDHEAAMKAWRKKFPHGDDGQGYSDEAIKKMPPHSIDRWEEIREWKSFLSPSYFQADRDALESYENAKKSFVGKNVDKMENVLGALDVDKVQITMVWKGGYFDGRLYVELPAGSFRAEISLKYVIRTVPKVTPYYQYPLNFLEVTWKGKKIVRPSEAELKALLQS